MRIFTAGQEYTLTVVRLLPDTRYKAPYIYSAASVAVLPAAAETSAQITLPNSSLFLLMLYGGLSALK